MNRQVKGQVTTPANPIPAKPKQALVEKYFPLFSMLVLFSLLQVLSAFFYNPLGEANGEYYAPPVVRQDIPFSILVRNTRVGLGMSRKILAQKVHLSIPNIEAIEEGKAVPTGEIETALRIALDMPLVTMKDEFVTNVP